MKNVKVIQIINHGSVIQILATDEETGDLVSIVGDHRPMRDAIAGLDIVVGSIIATDGEVIGEAA